ncbi:hypothetical protein NA66_1001711 [Burkholderia pyrrocinia]|uniref:Uncharacterized protein n=2 Tax=Burkholderiaceae TaxID=119060 RepID=A0A318J370_BURPY|nr:hypothetical protein NA66_1001711 [Burkholderia pyrrocinia]SFW58275.1 hypothetical protein SAMN03159384_03028 [Burkholderia sp. NFACC33-1]SFY11549.1 hypothetical protein SAMN03159408_03240 [Burkholderia sp. NFPP32]
MSKKRKAYRPRPVRLNACATALERNRVMKQAVTADFTDELEIAALAAIDAVARGHGTKDQWDTLANCLNHGWLLAKAGLGAEARETFNDAHEAMRRMVPVYHETSVLAFQSKPDQESVESAIALWIEQLKIITIGELAGAMQVVEENYWKHREA